MDWQTFIAIGIVLAFIVAVLDITGHLFGLRDRWSRRRKPAPPSSSDQVHLTARIVSATGMGNGFRRLSKRGDSGTITIEFRNKGLHPAYDFRPTLTSGNWNVSGHASGIAIPSHEVRFFEFPFPYPKFPLQGSHEFIVEAPFRDGIGSHLYRLLFLFDGQEFPDWQPVIERQEIIDT
jgi:hypothetical protein